jgi:hypothetical protein
MPPIQAELEEHADVAAADGAERGGVLAAVTGEGLHGVGHHVEDVGRVPRQPQQCVGELPGGELADPFHTVFGGDPVRGRGGLGQTESHGRFLPVAWRVLI